ncbi:Inositol polyphosphate-5-phosphatase A, partial [Fragariocoptes setiger]
SWSIHLESMQNQPQTGQGQHEPKSVVSNNFTSVDNSITCMLITANVGSLFFLNEDNLTNDWIEQFRLTTVKHRPQFIGLHCQEVGGKNYECHHTTKFVTKFLEKVLQLPDLASYGRVRIFLDQDFRIEKFTALGNLYFVHDSIKNVEIWNFNDTNFVAVTDRKIFSGILDDADCIENIKFPKEFHPDITMSRKGFMRSRWRFEGQQVVEFVNIHLFHDSSNFPALNETPSRYAKIRQRALEYTLKEIAKPIEGRGSKLEIPQSDDAGHIKPNSTPTSNDDDKPVAEDAHVPMFIFGDFNFRLTTNGVIKRITNGERVGLETDFEGDYYKFSKCYGSNDGVTVRHKYFGSNNGLEAIFLASDNRKWLLEYDNEPEHFKSQLFEFDIKFFPSYPFQEGKFGDCNYAMTRCPSWCDRILFNKCARDLIVTNKDCNMNCGNASHQASEISDPKSASCDDCVIYKLMGSDVPMGDHKPVMLTCRIMIKNK